MAIMRLPEQVANQIAAGEVVERPASVVKELVENAMDAQAKNIDIHIEEAGMKRIQVIDDGQGLAPKEMELALERHATSKIYTSQDLFRIHSLGFRGEALPSIASVSEFSLASSNGQEGRYLAFQGGKKIADEASHLRQGTEVVVENLFFNTPARLKYVRSLRTELAHITNIINRHALARPDIRFSYYHDGKLMLETNGKGRLQEVMAAIYGFQEAKVLEPFAVENLDFQVEGLLSPPRLTRASKNYISLFVNSRFIRNYALTNALIRGYGKMLMIGRYPIAAIKITCDAQLLDVNVHPTKMEVRISKEAELCQLLEAGVRELFLKQERIPEAMSPYDYTSSQVSGRYLKQEQYTEQEALPLEHLRVEKKEGQKSQAQAPTNWVGQDQVEESRAAGIEPTAPASDDIELPKAERHHKHKPAAVWSDVHRLARIDEKAKVEDRPFPALDYIGQAHGTYLLATDPSGLYLLDQHAVQERIKYEYFREQLGQPEESMQELLMPLVFNFSADEALAVEALLPRLREMHIHLETFGPTSFQLTAHPTWIHDDQIEETVDELIALALADPKAGVREFREAAAIMMSCKLSIKANHYLADEEACQLLEDLSQCENPFNCSHGRPTMIHFKTYDIERLFKRIQDPKTDV